jgi:hypothetical protein
MHDRANVVSHAHASVVNPDGPQSDTVSIYYTNTIEQRNGEWSSKSPEPKRKDDIFVERCLSEIRESNRTLMEGLRATEEMKISLLMSMQATMVKLVDKL